MKDKVCYVSTDEKKKDVLKKRWRSKNAVAKRNPKNGFLERELSSQKKIAP